MLLKFKIQKFFKQYGILKLLIVGILFAFFLVILRSFLQNQHQKLNINISDSPNSSIIDELEQPMFINNFEFSGINEANDKFFLSGKRAIEKRGIVDILLPYIEYHENGALEYNANASKAIFDKQNSLIVFDVPISIKRSDGINFDAKIMKINLKTKDLFASAVFIQSEQFTLQSEQMEYQENLSEITFSGNVHIVWEEN